MLLNIKCHVALLGTLSMLGKARLEVKMQAVFFEGEKKYKNKKKAQKDKIFCGLRAAYRKSICAFE